MPRVSPAPGVNVGLPGSNSKGERIAPISQSGLGAFAQGVEGFTNALIRKEAAKDERARARAEKEQERQDTLKMARSLSDANQTWAQSLQQSEADPNLNPDAYLGEVMTRFDAERQRMLASAPESVRDTMEQRLLTLEDDVFERALKISAKHDRLQKADNLDATIRANANAVLLDDSAFPRALAETVAAVRAAGLGADATRDTEADTRARLSRSLVRGLIERDPARARDELRAGTFNLDLPEGELSSFIGDAEDAVAARDKDAEARRTADDKQRKAEEDDRNATLTANLDLAVSRGEAGYTEIAQARADGWLTPAKATAFNKRVDARDKDDLTRQDRITLGAGAYAGDIVLDPKDTGHRKAADEYFAVKLTEWRGLPPADQATQVGAFVARTGIVPDRLRGHIRGMLRAGDDDMKAAAADMIDRISQTNPAALNDFAREDVAAGTMIAQFVRMGMEPGQAASLSQGAVYDAQTPERETRTREIREGDLVENGVEHVIDEIDGGIFNDPDVPQALVGEAGALYRAFYLDTGDDEAARTLTLRAIRGQWGQTEIGGKRLMKFAPEVVYGNGADADWIGEQLHAELRAESLVPGIEDDDLGERVRLEADARTLRELSAGPTYQVWVRDDDGVWSPLVGDDGPLRWRPEWESAPEKQRMDRRARERLNQARRNRALLPQALEDARTTGAVVPEVGKGAGVENAAHR